MTQKEHTINIEKVGNLIAVYLDGEEVTNKSGCSCVSHFSEQVGEVLVLSLTFSSEV